MSDRNKSDGSGLAKMEASIHGSDIEGSGPFGALILFVVIILLAVLFSLIGATFG